MLDRHVVATSTEKLPVIYGPQAGIMMAMAYYGNNPVMK